MIVMIARVVAAVAAVVGVAWLVLAARLVLLVRRDGPVAPIDGPTPPDAPPVDAIVAARDEEREIEAAVLSIVAQEYPALCVRVVDDQSADRTGPILDALASDGRSLGRLRVIHGAERPAGWVGKTWALQQGVAQAGAEWLWFVDGDMVLHPRALATALDLARRTGSDLVSFLPRPECRTFWQGAIALTLAELLSHLFPMRHVNNPARPEALAAGGFLLVRRSVYERAGGHAAVRGEIIEDIQLARRIKAAGGRLVVRPAPALASTHMYGTFGEIWRGLRKNAYAGMDYRPHKYATGAIVALTLAWAPHVALGLGWLLSLAGRGGPELGASRLALGAGALGLAAQLLATAPFAGFLGLGPWYALTLPVGITLYVAIATSSAWHHHRGRVLWKGRTYAARDVVARPDGDRATPTA